MNPGATIRGIVWLTLATTAVLALIVSQVPRFVSLDNAEAVIVSAVICVAAGWVALIPPVVAFAAYQQYVAQAGVASIGLRLLLTLVVGMVALKWSRLPQEPFLNAMTYWYLILLVVETVLIAVLAQRGSKSTSARAN